MLQRHLQKRYEAAQVQMTILLGDLLSDRKYRKPKSPEEKSMLTKLHKCTAALLMQKKIRQKQRAEAKCVEKAIWLHSNEWWITAVYVIVLLSFHRSRIMGAKSITVELLECFLIKELNRRGNAYSKTWKKSSWLIRLKGEWLDQVETTDYLCSTVAIVLFCFVCVGVMDVYDYNLLILITFNTV